MIGFFRATWPFATLSADSTTIVVSVLGKKYMLPKTAIQSIKPYKKLIASGVEIEHSVSQHPSPIVFLGDVRSDLEALGYPVFE